MTQVYFLTRSGGLQQQQQQQHELNALMKAFPFIRKSSQLPFQSSFPNFVVEKDITWVISFLGIFAALFFETDFDSVAFKDTWSK